MNPLEIVTREYDLIRQKILLLEEVTYSPSVNVRDFYSLFKEICRLWDIHEEEEEKLLKLLHVRGYINYEKLTFNKGLLDPYQKAIMDALKSGNEAQIKEIIKTRCGELIDILRAHMFANELALQKVSLRDIDEETMQKIKIMQIIPSDDFL